jgi:cytochrome bd ubiquinol oxidase subunit II
MGEPTPALAIALAIMVSLNAYVLLAGADFGGGMWDLLATGPRRQRQRQLIEAAMGPVWEANHVWLILVVVLLFTCFPPVFSRLAIMLHIPLSLMLIGIVLRGSAFTFRSYDTRADHAQRRWGRVFSIASLVTPFLLGMMVGAIASARLGGSLDPEARRDFTAVYLAPWLSPFCFANGLFALSLFAFMAAVYLTVEAREEDLQEDFRRKALLAAFAVFGAALLALLLSSHDEAGAPLMWQGLIHSPWAKVLQGVIGVSALTALGALWKRSFMLARVAAAAQVSLILWGWAVAQYPYLVPPDLTIAESSAPPITLKLVLGALVVGAAVLVPSLYYLFRVFKTAPGPTSRHPSSP